MLGEVRGPFGEHQGYVQLTPNLNGHAAFLIIGIVGAAAYHLLFGMASVLDHPEEHAWVYVFATHFYYYTAFVPLRSVLSAWNFITSMTPWGNLNFILGIILTPIYGYLALVLLAGVWIGVINRILRLNAAFIYMAPALMTAVWAAGSWLFA